MTKAAAQKQIQRVRSICLGYPGVTEKVSHGEPTFFTPKRVFTMISNNHHGDEHVAAWLPAAPGVQGELIAQRPDAFYNPPYVGKGGWVGVELAHVDDDELGALIHEAYGLMVAKDKPKRTSQNGATNHRIAVARVTLRRGKSSGAEPHTKGVGRSCLKYAL